MQDDPIIDKRELVERVIFPGLEVEYRFNKYDIRSEYRGKINMTDMKPITETVYLADVKRDKEKKLVVIPFLTDVIAWGNYTGRTQTLGLSILADFFGENNTRNWFQRELIDPFKSNPYPGSDFWLAMHSAGWTLASIFYQEFTIRLLSSEKSDRFTISGKQIMKFLNRYGILLRPLIRIMGRKTPTHAVEIIPGSKAATLTKEYGSPYPIGGLGKFYNKDLGEPFKEK